MGDKIFNVLQGRFTDHCFSAKNSALWPFKFSRRVYQNKIRKKYFKTVEKLGM